MAVGQETRRVAYYLLYGADHFSYCADRVGRAFFERELTIVRLEGRIWAEAGGRAVAGAEGVEYHRLHE